MTIMTRKNEAVLQQLIQLAGDSRVVEEALRSLNEESTKAPTMREVVRRILELKYTRASHGDLPGGELAPR